ncbi:MAG: hypothetical protein ACHQ52_09270 [Candidatus Eisenbacteria bacterium]
MPSLHLQFARATARIACLVLLSAVLPTGASSAGATHDTPGACAGVTDSAPTTGVDVRPGLWRLVSGDRTPVVPYDPTTFIGPPAPLALLFAPAAMTAGMRIEIEPGTGPAPSTGVAPPAEKLIRYADVFSKLVPVRHPDGSVSIDLTGVYMTDIDAWIDVDGVHLSEDGASTAPVVR